MAVLVRRRHEPADIRSDYLRFQIAKKLFGGSAERDDDALLVDHDHCIRDRREDRAQMAGIRQQSGFGSPLLGGVAQDLAEPAELAILFVQRSDRYMRQEFGTILADPPVLFLEFAQFACALQIYPWIACLHCIDGMKNRAMLANDLRLGPPLQALRALVPDCDPPFRLEPVDRIPTLGRRSLRHRVCQTCRYWWSPLIYQTKQN